ncbi:MAG: SusC/RagA family TonB-linked outer membrane protein [Bacteroidota bacterium]|nr:SusC/RagA family TonB-linked outer membrane protein [Bacteroidota bacterium]
MTGWISCLIRLFNKPHQLSVSGKSEKSNYYLSVGVLDQPGMLAFGSNSNKRYFTRLKYKIDVTDKLSISTNVSLERKKILEPSYYDNAVAYASSSWTTQFPRTPKGNYFNFGGFPNAIAMAEASGERESDANQATVLFTINYQPVKGIEITGDYSMNRQYNSGNYYNKIIQHYDYDDVPTMRWEPNSAGSSIHLSMHKVANLYANYKYFLNNHNFELMAGASHEENDYKFFSASRDKLISEAVPLLTMGDPTLQNTNENRSQWALQSYFGRLNYDFNGKYLFEGTMRRDGSSRFAEGYQWGNYFGGSGAWLASEESFVKNLKVFDYLKFRLSYGELGNQNNVGLYDHISIINIGGLSLFGNPDSPTRNLVASTSGTLPSPNRTWETVAIQNLGVDFRLLNSRLKGSFDYFIKNTSDMLVTKEFPEVLGIAPSTVNGGKMKTKGWEFSLNWSDKIKNELNYFAKFTLADDQSEITFLEDSRVPRFGLNSFVEGQPYNSYYTLAFDGFIQNQAELTEYKKITGVPSNLRVGDARYNDLDGDGKIEYSEYKKGDPNSGDLVNIGSSTMRFQYGLTVGFDWKGIDFSAFLQGIGKWNVMSGIKQPGATWWEDPLQLTMGKDWTEANPNSLYPKATADGGIDSWNYQQSNAPYKWYTTRYIRLKNVQLGYSLPSNWTNRLKISKVRVYFSGNDLWEITNIPKGFDPEKPFFGALWTGFTPFPRTYSFGIDITL